MFINNNRAPYSFQKDSSGIFLVCAPRDHNTQVARFSLSIPDPDGQRTTDRLPLPDHMMNEKTASAIFAKAIGLFIDKQGVPLEKVSSFPLFSACVDRPNQYVWAQHIK